MRHRELVGASVFCGPEPLNPIALAMQGIRFDLGEKGAVLESYAAIATWGAVKVREKPWEYIFDRPFLIAMIQSDAESPYFLMWVGNDELLTERVEAND